MLRFTLREIFLVTVIVAMGTMLAVEHWTAPDGRKLTKTELEIYSAAFRFAIAKEHPDGLIFLSIAGSDPPRKLTGTILLPASQADVFAVKDDPSSDERVRHKKTGEAGSIVTAKIVQWLGKDRVRVKVGSHTAGLWGQGDTILLALKGGEWLIESIDENESWAS